MAYLYKVLSFARLLALIPCVFLFMGSNILETSPEEFESSLRFLSYALRDSPPSLEETQSVKNRDDLQLLSANWQDSPEHVQKLFRIFNELIGVYEGISHTRSHLWLQKNKSGILYLNEKGSCDSSQSQEVETWWSDTKVTVCNSTISDSLRFPKDGSTLVCTSQGGSWGMGDPRCGCGPLMIGCFPYELLTRLNQEVVQEIGFRGVDAFTNNSSWIDFIGGNYVYGSRLLYWRYLFANGIINRGQIPDLETLNLLRNIPLFDKVRTPLLTGTIPRAGVISSLGFMNQYSNFRSRTRILVEAFLCRKVDGTLNSHNLTQYLNKDLGSTEIKHSTKPDCAACHLGLDNLASMLLGFSGAGSIDPMRTIKINGAAFGSLDVGAPGFARSLVLRNNWFHPCMARRFWEAMTGEDFDTLPAEERTELAASSLAGPKALIEKIGSMPLFYHLRPVQKVTTYADNTQVSTTNGAPSATQMPKTEEMPFSEIKPILERQCGMSGCHGKGSAFGDFVHSEDHVKDAFQSIKERIQLTGGGKMPPGERHLLPDEKTKLLKYLDQWEY